jgi:hypothetical protein
MNGAIKILIIGNAIIFLVPNKRKIKLIKTRKMLLIVFLIIIYDELI